MRYRTLLLASLLAGTLMITGSAMAERDFRKAPDVQGQDLEQMRIRGTIESIDNGEATILTNSGRRVGVALGPEWYWGRRGARLESGSHVTVDCWGDPYDRSDFYYAGAIWGPGFYFELTNDDGVPYWIDGFSYYHGWWPTYGLYADWYGCGPGVYHYIVPPLAPRSRVFYYPRVHRRPYYWRSHEHQWYRDHSRSWNHERRDRDERPHYDNNNRDRHRNDARKDERRHNPPPKRSGRRSHGR
jgi:hypothetical protein